MPTRLVPRKEGSAQTKNSRGWKATQALWKTKKKINLALFIIAVVATLLVLGQVVNFTKILFGPWREQSQSIHSTSLSIDPESTEGSKDYLWDGTFNINVVVKSSSISLLTFSPDQEKVTVIPIPDQTYLKVPSGFGFWQARSVYGLGGNKLLKSSLTAFLGIPIDGFIKLEGTLSQKNAQGLVEFLRSSPINIIATLKNLQTDLTLLELLRLNIGLNKVRFDKVQTLDLKRSNVLSEEILADGTQVLTADPVRIDGVLKPGDPKLQKEYLTIAVFNATDKEALAQKAKRLITNMGGNVIQIGNTHFKLDKTYIFTRKDLKGTDTLKRLTEVFDCCDKIDSPDLSQLSTRAQINIILGEDFAKRYGD